MILSCLNALKTAALSGHHCGRPGYVNRKFECYALLLVVYFLIIEAMVEEEKDEAATMLQVEAFKDTGSVIHGVMYEMAKVDYLLETMWSSRSALVAYTSLEVALVRNAEIGKETMVKVTKYMKNFQ